MTAFYASVKVLMKLMLQLYFRRIKIEGIDNVPKNTPLLITPNHQNALIDALLVGAFSPIPLHYLTRSDVFKPWLTPLLKRVNMMPIYRIRDGYSKLSLNDQVFASCKEVFKKKGSVLIFPEGNHGKEYFLRPLTKGAARLALQSQAELDDDLMVLPVGLNFFNHRKPQSTVLIKYGEPVSVKEFLSAYQESQTKGLISMRDAISEGMRRTLIIPDQTEDYEERKRAVFQEQHEDLSFTELKEINLSEVSVEDGRASKHWLAKVLNPVPFLIIHRVLSRVEDVVFHSTLKFGVGIFAFPIWWAVVFLLLSLSVGINIAILAVIVMVTGLFYSYQR
jgi:1-acyl-sn-glycerol-3-phosphate acyltransferase